MLSPITNAIPQTHLLIIILAIVLLASLRRKKDSSFFSVDTTTELKGLAILMVVLSHIGYFLVSDQHFLVPLSNYAGVGVDLFLILSGYGIMTSALRKPLSTGQFYRKRLSKIYLPVLLTLVILLISDALILHIFYPASLTIKNLLGFFPSADLYTDINSPLWFITPLLVQYLLFPLVFYKRMPLLAPLAIALFGWIMISLDLPKLLSITWGVYNLYRLHFIGFPLGLLLGAVLNQPPIVQKKWLTYIHSVCQSPMIHRLSRWGALVIVTGVVWVLLNHSMVGETWKKEEGLSVLTALAMITFFIIKKTEVRLLTLFGQFSFEIYLLHWPLLYRYHLFYQWVPAGIATLLYLSLFITLGWCYQKIFLWLSLRLSNKKIIHQ